MTHAEFRNQPRRKKIMTIAGWSILGIFGATAFAFLFGYFIMLLWNWLMPELFGLATVNYWKAVGIVLLARLIFGSFGHKHGDHKHHRHDSKCPPFWDKKEPFKHRSDFSKWKHYDKFWKERGQAAFEQYLAEKEGRVEDAEEIKEDKAE